ncbi:Serine/threonine protein kinase PrkC, regulator of stationary phase [Minicystis rosea]|nr:Serine/threonine protein kinase PrkC, regulator of stationary phase [Minicystis rosea]
MAAVYRGEQDAEPAEVAVKVMHPELLRDETFAKRFAREAKAAARIVHRNTVRIVEQGADGPYLYLAMELLVGQDLFDTLVRERRLAEARAVRIAIQVCAALEAAHAHRIVHRDLKPENVFLERDPADPEADLVKVLDFGIAKTMERDASDEAPPSSEPMSAPPSSVLTRVGSIVGTPEYMAPEQAMGLPVDARTDVYACGVLLFHMITGRQPFVGQTPIEVLLQLNDQPPPAPSSLVAGINPALERLILTALAKSAVDRPESARALRTSLEALLPELGTSKHRPLGAPASAPKISGLPGVPGAVAISTDPKSGRRDPKAESDEPPATLRSLPPEEEAMATTTAPAEARVEAAASREGTIPRVSLAEPDEEPHEETKQSYFARPNVSAATSREPDAKPRVEAPLEKAPTTKPRARAPEAAGSPLFASSAGSGWILPPWVLFVGLAAIVIILWRTIGAR